jgi:hypothetical protein
VTALTTTGALLWSQRAGRFLPRDAQDIIGEPSGGYIVIPSVKTLTTSEVILVSEASQCIGQMAHFVVYGVYVTDAKRR